MINHNITLESLIKEGHEIREGIKFIQTNFLPKYVFKDELNFQEWKNKCIRFLGFYFAQDRSMIDFEAILDKYNGKKPNQMMDELLGLLAGVSSIPDKVESTTNQKENNSGFTFKQNLSQSQFQVVELSFFIEIIKNELSEKQLEEIKEIIHAGEDEKTKSKLIDKLKSFGSDVLSNVLANIITNPAIWSHF